jgi:uncharacterized protein
MNALAFWYNNGRGVKKDHAEGVFWLRRAVEAGNPDAMYWLARAYQSDGHLGIWPPDHAAAARLYRQAADAGHSVAMVGLALMQDHGQGGFKPDAAAAARLLFQALQAGDEDAYAQMLTFGGSWFTQGFRREMQVLLKDAGVYDGPTDGNFGPPTMTAFQALKQPRQVTETAAWSRATSWERAPSTPPPPAPQAPGRWRRMPSAPAADRD